MGEMWAGISFGQWFEQRFRGSTKLLLEEEKREAYRSQDNTVTCWILSYRWEDNEVAGVK